MPRLSIGPARSLTRPAGKLAAVAAATLLGFAGYRYSTPDLSEWEHAHQATTQGLRESAARIAADPSFFDQGADETDQDREHRIQSFAGVCQKLGVEPPSQEPVRPATD